MLSYLKGFSDHPDAVEELIEKIFCGIALFPRSVLRVTLPPEKKRDL